MRFAQELRRSPTEAERVLWERLRRKATGGFRFRRQHPIGPYIADFYCNEVNLVIEVDGGIHDESAARERDRLRDLVMEEHGLRVVRVSNREVMTDLDAAVARIERALVSGSQH